MIHDCTKWQPLNVAEAGLETSDIASEDPARGANLGTFGLILADTKVHPTAGQKVH